jgi:DNA adenine methylase
VTATAPFAYFGGKTRLADRIVDLLPEHQHYVEPFAGSLAVLLAKPRLPFETVNDLDGRVMTFWRVLRDRPEDLIRVCALTPHSREEHEQAYNLREDLDELEAARRVWVILSQGRAGTLRKTGWRFYEDPTATSSSMPRYIRGYVERLGPAADLRSTRASRQYGVEMSSDQEHEDLAAALNACRAAVVLSGYPSPLYDALYSGWHRIEIPTMTGNGAAGALARTEVLWSNRPFPVEQHLFSTEAAS